MDFKNLKGVMESATINFKEERRKILRLYEDGQKGGQRLKVILFKALQDLHCTEAGWI